MSADLAHTCSHCGARLTHGPDSDLACRACEGPDAKIRASIAEARRHTKRPPKGPRR